LPSRNFQEHDVIVFLNTIVSLANASLLSHVMQAHKKNLERQPAASTHRLSAHQETFARFIDLLLKVPCMTLRPTLRNNCRHSPVIHYKLHPATANLRHPRRSIGFA
jgi:hypothetical protein